MLRTIVYIVIAFISVTTYAEDFYIKVLGPTACFIDYKSNEIEIPEEPMNVDLSIQKAKYLLNKDLFGYYDLSQNYPTPLQKEVFKETKEYAELLENFNQIYENTKNTKFYILYDLYNNSSYNLDSKSFKFKIGLNDYNTTSKAGYFGIGGDICLSYPASKLSVRKTLTRSGSDYWLDQYLTTPSISTEIALNIEKQMSVYPCPLSLLFVVVLDKVSTEQRTLDFGGYVGRKTVTSQFILCKTIGLYIVNTDTNDIIADLSSVFTSNRKQGGKTTKRR